MGGEKKPWKHRSKFEKCLKQGKCSICSIFLGQVQKKCLKQGKCSICSICSIFWGNLPCWTHVQSSPKKLNILNILNISLVLSTFFEHGQKGLNILSISPVLGTFWFLYFIFQCLSSSKEWQSLLSLTREGRINRKLHNTSLLGLLFVKKSLKMAP